MAQTSSTEGFPDCPNCYGKGYYESKVAGVVSCYWCWMRQNELHQKPPMKRKK